MKKIFIIFFVIFSARLFALTANEIMQRAYDRDDGKTMIAEMEMTLDSGKDLKKRKFITISMDQTPKITQTIVSFLEPQNIKGTSLLTIDEGSEFNDQWIYLPAFKKIRRIASSGKGTRFVGSDIYYEDFDKREVTEDEHLRLADSKYNNINCYVIQNTPINKKSTSYNKVVTWIHSESFLVVKAEFYQKDKLHKVLTTNNIKKIQNIWTVFDSEIFNKELNHKTILKITNIVYNKPLNDNLFAQGNLSSPQNYLNQVRKVMK